MSAAQPVFYTESDYYNLPEGIRAELIDGKIYNQAAPSRIHQKLLGELYTVINTYIKTRNGFCQVYPAPFAVKLLADQDTIVEPDISVICDHSKLTDRGCSGAPDWIVEIVSPSSTGHDYIHKLQLYAEAGVREYWIVDPMEQRIVVYHLEQEAFDVNFYTFQDQVKAGIYEDFWIDFREITGAGQ